MYNWQNACFVIGPIGSPGTVERTNADLVLDYLIEPAVKEFQELGFRMVRADQLHDPSHISNDIIQGLVNAPIVIADLSTLNANVFYELAIRHAVQKPIIQLISDKEKIPFDVAVMRTILFSLGDRRSEEHAKDELIRQIKAVTENPTPRETPVSIALKSRLIPENDAEVGLARNLKSEGLVNAFRIPRQNPERQKRVDELIELEANMKRVLRLSASSGHSYLHRLGQVWQVKIRDMLESGRLEKMIVVLESPFSHFAKTRALANHTSMHHWEEKVPMDVLIKRIRDSRIEIRVTEQPVNCSLFFAGGSVYYDPYIWAVHPSRPTENNFWVFEYRNTGVPNNCYSLLEAHFKFLHDHSVPVEEILHEPLSGGSTPLGEEFYQMWCKDNVFALNRYNKMTEEFHNELSGKR